MDHSLINKNQIRSFGIPLSDDPFDRNLKFGIDHKKMLIPFSMEGKTILFNTYVPPDH